MNTEIRSEKFEEFRMLRRCVASLIGCSSLLDERSRDDIDMLDNLSRKIEVSALVQQREIIAVAGMQGTGKSTFIKNLYNIPEGILQINSSRGERTPIFITEKAQLKQGEYATSAVMIKNGEILVEEIDAADLAEKSRIPENVMYFELCVPYTFFHRENGGFVLLPGFEKTADRTFAKDYNSLMEYTLHFAKAVVMVVDDSTMANSEIDRLMEILGENFTPQNCIFAISKCDTKLQQEVLELKEELLSICKEKRLNIGTDQVVCVGEYIQAEKNELWKKEILNAIESHVDFNASLKEYRYYKPMVREILDCADRIGKAITAIEVKYLDTIPLYEELEKALLAEGKAFEERLETACKDAKKKVRKEFADAYETIPNKHKSKKKFFFLEKKYGEIVKSQDYIEEKSHACLKENGKSVLCSVYQQTGEVWRKGLPQEYKELLLSGIKTEIEANGADEIMEKAHGLLWEAMEKYFDKRTLPDPIHDGKESIYDKKTIAAIVAKEFAAFFDGALINGVNTDSIPIRTAGVAATMNAIRGKRNFKTDIVKVIGLIDLLDGKSDILEAMVGVFYSGGKALVSKASGIAAIAIAVVSLGKGCLDYYNGTVRANVALGEAWERALMNAVEEQKNACLDAFEEASQKLLDYISDVHRSRYKLAASEQRIHAATYAVANVKYLMTHFDDRYARSICEGV